ncbi:MAG TPA: 1,4-alpha-glucan branching protein GlgB [Gemmatimonas sp.]|nr:1,4-alpha-glucan branching protein GlgB [Gemmatimonas sp.]
MSDSTARVIHGESRAPHDVLGAHVATLDGVDGVVFRILAPGATDAWILLQGEAVPMSGSQGLFVLFRPGLALPVRYRVRAEVDGVVREYDDPYRFPPTLGDIDLHLFGEGRHLRLWEKLGAHARVIDGVAGVSFAVWAPNAVRVSVIGSFNGWDGRTHQMRALGGSGVFELFVPGLGKGAIYKYEIRSPRGGLRVKTDPFAAMMEQSPGHAAVVVDEPPFAWNDAEWLARRADAEPTREPMLVYEVHLASWMRSDDNGMLSYRELAPRLAAHVKRLGFTHIELLPVQEHPFGGSWGYQVGGYFAPTSRHGTPDDFRAFVDVMHDAGIGVLLDWVPAHFPKDDWALRRFDGTACYEHEDPRLGDHPEWGTHIFNYARHEVRNFLLANALYWIEEFHIDGLRVDAVASMLYLDYGREAGQWLRNRFGGRENLEAVSFLKQLNHTVHSLHPGVVTIAEESTTWPRVTHPIVDGGLGFTFKWNMGWMHDTLDYFRIDPLFRRGAHDKLTFAMMYEHSERFVNPLSHDEVVHLKKSLLEKMPGDAWQRFAGLRALLGYTITRPGKSLLFMGTELAPQREWNHDASLEWHLASDPRRQGIDLFLQELGALYNAHSAFWRRDHEPGGFSWIDVADREQSVLSYARFDGTAHAIVVLNLTPVPRESYRIGTPGTATYRHAINSDETRFGGSGFAVPAGIESELHPYHGFPQSVVLTLPPMSVIVLLPDAVPSPEALDIDSADMLVPPAPAIVAIAGADDAETRALMTISALLVAPPTPKAPKLSKAPKPSKPAKAAKAPKTPKTPTPTPAPEHPKSPKPSKPSKPAKEKKSVKEDESGKPVKPDKADKSAKKDKDRKSKKSKEPVIGFAKRPRSKRPPLFPPFAAPVDRSPASDDDLR